MGKDKELLPEYKRMQMISIEEIPVERIDEFWDIHICCIVDYGINLAEQDIA